MAQLPPQCFESDLSLLIPIPKIAIDDPLSLMQASKTRPEPVAHKSILLCTFSCRFSNRRLMSTSISP